MSFNIETSDDLQGDGSYVKEPGNYHAVVVNAIDGSGPKGGPIDGFFVEFEIHDGSGDASSHQLHGEAFFRPDLSRSEGAQLAAKRKATSFFIATGLMKPEQLGKPVNIDLEHAVNRQCVIKLVPQKRKNEAGDLVETDRLQIDYSAIFHVDDPEVADVPKDEELLGDLPSNWRHGPEWFAFKKRKQKKVAAASDDFSDL